LAKNIRNRIKRGDRIMKKLILLWKIKQISVSLNRALIGDGSALLSDYYFELSQLEYPPKKESR